MPFANIMTPTKNSAISKDIQVGTVIARDPKKDTKHPEKSEKLPHIYRVDEILGPDAQGCYSINQRTIIKEDGTEGEKADQTVRFKSLNRYRWVSDQLMNETYVKTCQDSFEGKFLPDAQKSDIIKGQLHLKFRETVRAHFIKIHKEMSPCLPDDIIQGVMWNDFIGKGTVDATTLVKNVCGLSHLVYLMLQEEIKAKPPTG